MDEGSEGKIKSIVSWATVVFVVLLLLAGIVYASTNADRFPQWTGVPEFNPTADRLVRQKTLWDWLDLLIIGSVIAAGGFLLNRSMRTRELRIAERNRNETTLQTYYDKMADLILENQLEKEQGRSISRARTLATLRTLDSKRKGSLLAFLYESELIGYLKHVDEKKKHYAPIISLHGADLSGAYLSQAKLEGADLSETNLSEARMSVAKLASADLSKAFIYQANLRIADLQRANLSEAFLREADLLGADLSGANLCKAIMSDAKLRMADLDGANLTEASLWRANLSEANLSGTELQMADLREANLSKASLRGADLRGARYNKDTHWPHGFDPVQAGADLLP